MDGIEQVLIGAGVFGYSVIRIRSFFLLHVDQHHRLTLIIRFPFRLAIIISSLLDFLLFLLGYLQDHTLLVKLPLMYVLHFNFRLRLFLLQLIIPHFLPQYTLVLTLQLRLLDRSLARAFVLVHIIQ